MSSSSRDIIDQLVNSLSNDIKDPTILFEKYPISYEDIDSRQDIRKARVSIYEISELTTITVDDGRANMSTQTYGIDISVVRGYTNNNAKRGELILYEIRDKIIDWARDNLDVSALTGGYIYTFKYNSSSSFTRSDRFVSRTMYFDSMRDLLKQQFTT
jgi:hypothetical protein